MNEMLDGKLVTKENLVNHFIESNDSLDGFIALVKEAFKEAEEKRKDSILEKLELFAIENNMSLEQVKAIFAPKSEEKKRKSGPGKGNAGEPKPKSYIKYEHGDNVYYAFRTLSGQQSQELSGYLKANNKKMKDLVIVEKELPAGIKELIEKDPNNIACVVKAA